MAESDGSRMIPRTLLEEIIAAVEKAHVIVNRHGTPEEYREVSEALAALYELLAAA